MSSHAKITAFLLIFRIATSRSTVSINEFKAPQAPLQNVLYVNQQEAAGVVVLAGRNVLYKLSADNLSLRATYSTGPKDDSLLCPPHPLECDGKRTPTDNDNQVLLRLGSDQLILACGTADQGMCSVHRLSQDLEAREPMDKKLPVNYLASRSSTAAFFGSGRNSDVLFVASAYDGRPPEYHRYVLSARALGMPESFNLHSSTPTAASFVNMIDFFKKSYRTRYVHGFSYNGFAYFVTVQNKNASLDTFGTRLVRVCEDDPSFRTYTELPIRCPRKEGAVTTDAAIAISASLQHSATVSSHGRRVLAVAFGTPFDGRWDVSDPSQGSELCFFDMYRVEAAFQQTVESCDKGTSKARLSPLFRHSQLDTKCSYNEKIADSINVCTPGVNSYIEGLETLTGTATMRFKEGLATSVTVMGQNGAIVAWVGDYLGYLHKVVRIAETSKLLFWTDLSNGEKTPIEKSTAIDNKGTFGYFLTADKVLKFPVGSCSIYDTCSKCLRSYDDPLRCGWCGGRCAHSAECPQGTDLVLDHCPVEIYSVSPRNGPISGCTMLTFVGDNFGDWWRESSSSIKITIGGHECQIINRVSTLVKCRTAPVQEASKVDIVISVNDTNKDEKKTYDVIDTQAIPSGFEYKIATLSAFLPDYGPAAGGTNITLFGVNLDIGFHRVVSIDGVICEIYKINETSLECSTSAATANQVEREMQVTLTIDGANIPFDSENGLGSTFTFMQNPFIESIAPKTAIFSEQPAIVVSGIHLDSVSKPKMVTRVSSLDSQKQESIAKACRVLEYGRKLVCPGSSLTEFSVISREELEKHRHRILAQVSFQMDGLHLPLTSTDSEGYFTFTYRPPLPSYNSYIGIASKLAKLTGILPSYGPVTGGTNLTLLGTNLDIGSKRLVTIGGSVCAISRVDSAFLDCTTSAVAADQAHREMRVSLTIDGAGVPFVPAENFTSTFTYKPEPTIYDIEPKAATISDTSVIVVHGQHLDSVATPVMVTRATSNDGGQDRIVEACQVTPDGRKMQCPRASLLESAPTSTAELMAHQLPIAVQISFQMDGLRLPLNSDGNESYFNFTCLPQQRTLTFSESLNTEAEDVVKVHTAVIIAAGLVTIIILLLLVVGIFCLSYHKLTICCKRLDLMAAERGVLSGEGTSPASCETALCSSSPIRGRAQSTRIAEGQPLIACCGQFDEEIKAMFEKKQLLFDRTAVVLGDVIGTGHFGRVYQGTLETEPGGDVVIVAVKTLHRHYAVRDAGSKIFLQEALIMKDFCHPNVLQLLGLTRDEKDGLMVITPYMKHGDLLTYIQDERNNVKLQQTMTFGIHVAEGMRYLSEMKFVHRDLAARNCMLSEHLVARVADFGLSRDIYEKEYYSQRNNGSRLPIRWMAPESIENGVYNTKTDVWAYGVLLWELMTRGAMPYPQIDTWDVLNFLNKGLRMQQPKSCPHELYQIMLLCWHQDPAKRPAFAKLVTDVTTLAKCLNKRTRNRADSMKVDRDDYLKPIEMSRTCRVQNN